MVFNGTASHVRLIAMNHTTKHLIVTLATFSRQLSLIFPASLSSVYFLLTCDFREYDKQKKRGFTTLFVKPLNSWLSGQIVEIVGVEPTTPCLQSRCSSQLSYTPRILKNFVVPSRLELLTPTLSV